MARALERRDERDGRGRSAARLRTAATCCSVDDDARQRRRGAADRRARGRNQGALRRLYAGRVRGSGRGAEVGGNPADGDRGIDRDPSGHQRDPAVLTVELDAILREHWWTAVASIARRTGDLEIAEDAVQ